RRLYETNSSPPGSAARRGAGHARRRAEEVRPGRVRHRDQDRQHQPVQRAGINKRKVTFISYDDGYSPPRTVEMVRKLVEQDEVLFIFQTLGTPSNTAIHKYMNMKKVPQMHVATGATKWNDPKNFPWT